MLKTLEDYMFLQKSIFQHNSVWQTKGFPKELDMSVGLEVNYNEVCEPCHEILW